MYAICHGEAAGAATIVPTGVQGNVAWIAAADGGTCFVTEDGYVNCVGTKIATPNSNAYCAGQAAQVELADVGPGNLVFSSLNLGGILCSNQDFYIWYDSVNPALLYHSVSYMSTGRTNLCITRDGNSVSCFAGSSTVASVLNLALLPYQGQVQKAFSGDDGACVYLQDESIACVGRYSLTQVASRPGHELQSAAISGAAMCFGWDDGWLCQRASASVMSSAEKTAIDSLITLWPIVQETPVAPSKPIAFNGLDVNARWGSTEGQLCVILTSSNQVWCQGTGFGPTGSAQPDATNGIFLMNAEDTAVAKQVVLSSSHVCAASQDPSNTWAWIVFGAIVVIVAICFWLGYLAWKSNRLRESNPFKFYGIRT